MFCCPVNSVTYKFFISCDPSPLQANKSNFVCKGYYLSHEREIT